MELLENYRCIQIAIKFVLCPLKCLNMFSLLLNLNYIIQLTINKRKLFF